MTKPISFTATDLLALRDAVGLRVAGCNNNDEPGGARWRRLADKLDAALDEVAPPAEDAYAALERLIDAGGIGELICDVAKVAGDRRLDTLKRRLLELAHDPRNWREGPL